MSIAIREEPELYTPAYNDISYIVTSDNSGQSNFKFVADVYVTDLVNGNYVERIKVNAHPTAGSGRVDIKGIIKNYVTSDISKTTYNFQRNSNSYVKYRVVFGEEYGTSGSETIYANLSSGTIGYVYNGIRDFEQFQNYSYPDYVIGSTSGVFLTDQPTTGVIRTNTDAWLHFIQPTTNDAGFLVINTYDSNNTLIQQAKITNSFLDITTDDNRFLRVGTGTRNLNLATLSSGTQPVITSSVAWYQVYLTNTSLSRTSEIRQWVIDTECFNHTSMTFHFLNEKGGFDTFTFLCLSKNVMNIERKFYKKRYGTQTATTWSYTKSERGDIQKATKIKDHITVNSNWINEEQSTWLEQLITSPEIYYDNGIDLIAINITNTNYEVKKNINEKIFNLVIEFEYNYDRYRQSS